MEKTHFYKIHYKILYYRTIHIKHVILNFKQFVSYNGLLKFQTLNTIIYYIICRYDGLLLIHLIKSESLNNIIKL